MQPPAANLSILLLASNSHAQAAQTLPSKVGLWHPLAVGIAAR